MNKESLIKVLEEHCKEGVTFRRLYHWTSREQDELNAQCIKETLKDI